MFLKTLLSPKIISILRIFTAHLDILNLLQNLTQGPPTFPDLSGSNRYLFILKPGDWHFKIFDEWKSWNGNLTMEIRFVYIFKLSHNSRSFPLSPLTWFKPQCWYLVFTWINQFKLICFLRYFWKIFLKEKGIFSNSEIRGKKSCAFIAHMGALMRRNKIILV